MLPIPTLVVVYLIGATITSPAWALLVRFGVFQPPMVPNDKLTNGLTYLIGGLTWPLIVPGYLLGLLGGC